MIDILMDETLLLLGITHYITWDLTAACHAIIIGASGSGKSYFFQLLAGKCALLIPDSKLYIGDFKGTEMLFLDGCDRYARYLGCIDLIQRFYDRLQARQRGEEPIDQPLFLFIDEHAVMVSSLDKKLAEEVKRQVSVILMLGRSLKMQLVIALQRGDAAHFNSGARDNFGLCVGLGNLSSESQTMLFSDYKHLIAPDRTRGTGFMTINGSDFRPVVVPTVRNMQLLHDTIRQGVTR